MAQGTLENPVINSPFVEPEFHLVMADGKPTGEIARRQRLSEFLVPVAQPNKKSAAALDQFGARTVHLLPTNELARPRGGHR